jgi:hypothetical protein
MIRITETIHHGEFRRVQFIDVDGEPMRHHIAQLLANSPYNKFAADDTSKIDRLLTSLLNGQRTELGWARYTLEER